MFALGCAIAAGLALAPAAYAEGPNTRYEFHIEEETLGEALRAFVRETNVLVLYPHELADKTGMNPVVGRYTISEAFDMLLRGSDFSGGLKESGVLTISPSSADKAQGQENEMTERGLKKSLLASVAAFVFGTGGAFAQVDQGTAEDQDEADQIIDQIIVVGSSIRRSARSDTNPHPIQFATEEDFRRTKATFVTDFLHQQPIFSGYNESVATNEFGGGESGINLRGVGSRYTLALVEGQRISNGESADLGAIPPLALEGVEILKTGASAIYGSDAVAGVVNLRLKKHFEGLELRTTYGQTTDHGDAGEWLIGAVFGHRDDRFSLTGSIAYQTIDSFTKFDRDRTASRDFRSFGGRDRRSGSIGEPHQIIFADDTVLSIDPTRFGPGDYSGMLSDYVPYDHETQAIGTHEVSTWPGINDRVSGHWYADYEILDGDRLTFFTYGYVDYRTQIFFRRYGSAFVDVPASNPYNPFGEDVEVSYLFGELGYETGDFATTAWTGVAGFEGNLVNDINYEVSFTSHRRNISEKYTNFINLDGLDAAAMRTDALAFNPFGYWANTPAQLDLVRAPEYNVDVSDIVKMVNAKVDGSLFDWYAGAVAFALGYQFRDGSHERVADFATTGINRDCCNRDPFAESRSVHSVFGELLVPVYQGASGDLLKSAELTGAVRREEYSDFGGVTVWQAGGKVGLWNDMLLFRASYSESFRAPDISALFEPQETRIETQLNTYDPVRDGVLPYRAIYGGNTELKPERGESLNIGAIFTPEALPGFFLTLDYWTLKVKDLIDNPDPNALMNGTSLIGSLTRDASLFPTLDLRIDNGGLYDISGVDAALRYNHETEGWGDFGVGLNATHMLKFTEVAADGVTVIERLDTLRRPELRAVLDFSWNYGPFGAALFFKHMSGWEQETSDERVDNYQTVDIQIGYELESLGARVHLGVENVLDAYLPFVADDSNGWARSFHDYRGRFAYAGVRKSF